MVAKLFARTSRRIIGAYLYSLKLEVNLACTLRCKMCYVNKNGTELPLPVILEVFRQVRNCGVRLEILGGEPLLRPELPHIVRLAKVYAKSPFVSLYTNGMHATRETSRRLHSAGLDAAIVSLVSYRAEVHERQTQVPGSWKRTVTGIRNLRNAGIRTYTFTAVQAENDADCEGTWRFVEDELGCHALFYQYIPQGPGDSLVPDSHKWNLLKNRILERKRVHREFVRLFYLLTGSACSGGNFVLTVKADGTVQPCPFVTSVPLGSVYTEDIWRIYRRRFRSAALRAFKAAPPECRACAYRSVCAGGCRAGGDYSQGSLRRMDHRCLGPFGGSLEPERVTCAVPAFF
jgi:radical SAM protein with 4Fe4S-binding SPASM domain